MAHQWRKGHKGTEITRKSLKQLERQEVINNRVTELLAQLQTERKEVGRHEDQIRA